MDHNHSHAYTATVERKPKSIAVISVVVPPETMASHRSFAVKSIGKNAQIDGFRKGHVPEKVLVERIGEMAILTETAEIVIRHIYPHILEEQKLDAVGSPEISITKLAPENPLEFTATIVLMPEIVLPDYKKIAKEKNAKKELVIVTDKDIEEAIEKIIRQRVVYERMQAKAASKHATDSSGAEESEPKENKDSSSEVSPDEASSDEDYSKLPLPKLTDEYVAGLGNFKTVDEFKTQLRSHLTNEKERHANAKHRAILTDAIVEESKIDLPELFIDSELAQMFGEMESDITRAGLKVDNYLEHLKKTREDLKKEWRPNAEKRAKLQLVLNEIAKLDSVTADSERVEKETAQLLEQFKGADVRRIKLYVESSLKNDAVLKMLETI